MFNRPGALYNQILRNDIRDNNRMSVNTPSPTDDDSGAFGVLLRGDFTEVGYNNISGSDAASYDYGRDGAAVEVYAAHSCNIHHNRSWQCDAFTELGKSGSADNTYAYNSYVSSNAQSVFLVTRGASSGYGPIYRTKMLNNSVWLTGSKSQGFVCHAGCNSGILTMQNNIIHSVAKAGYADGLPAAPSSSTRPTALCGYRAPVRLSIAERPSGIWRTNSIESEPLISRDDEVPDHGHVLHVGRGAVGAECRRGVADR